MSPAEIRALRPGSWLTFTPHIWTWPIDGQVIGVDHRGLLIEWDDGHTAPIPRDALHSTRFQPLDTEGLIRTGT